MDRITGLTVGFRASTVFGTAWGFGAGFTDLTWRGFAGSAREGDCLTPCLGGVVLVTEALDFEVGGLGLDVRGGGGFGAVFGLGAALDTGFDFCAIFGLGAGFCAALGLTVGFGVTFGFAAGFFAAAFGFAAGFFGAALDFAAGFGFGAAFFGAALGLAAGFFTAFGAATRVLFALDDFGAASAS